MTPVPLAAKTRGRLLRRAIVAGVRPAAIGLSVALALAIPALRGRPLVPLPKGLGPLALAVAIAVAGAFALPPLLARLARRVPAVAAAEDELALQTPGPLLVLASAAAEELLFRGALADALGPFVAAALFAVAHRLRGARGLAWGIGAFLFALAASGLVAIEGGLVAATLFHALINLRARRPADRAPPRPLGGLLARRGPTPVRSARG